MKFGRVDNLKELDLYLPADHHSTKRVLSDHNNRETEIYIGCAKWKGKDLQNFYPPGTSDELTYYSHQFNSVEMNATHYRNFPEEQIRDWYHRVSEDFKFFPKVNRYISHLKWLNDIEEPIDRYLESVIHFRDKMGTNFLQLRDKFAPKFFDRVKRFIDIWPNEIPLAMEFRHPDWFNDERVAEELYQLLEKNNIANVICDTAGHRDLLHMRLTNGELFVRYVGANSISDYERLDEWVGRIQKWHDMGLQKIHFFVHQNEEKASPILAAYFINGLNKELGIDLKVPNIID